MQGGMWMRVSAAAVARLVALVAESWLGRAPTKWAEAWPAQEGARVNTTTRPR